MQGKPMNTLEASRARVAKSPPMSRLIESIGAGWDDDCAPDRSRYDRIILLADPDVDGVHIRSLLLLFFHTWMRPILDAGMVFAARPPLWRLSSQYLDDSVYVWSDKQYQEVLGQLAERGIKSPDGERFRGLGNMVPEVLFETCLDPAERTLARLTSKHAEAAIGSYAQMRAQLSSRPR